MESGITSHVPSLPTVTGSCVTCVCVCVCVCVYAKYLPKLNT